MSVERTIQALTTGGAIVAENMVDGFDHTRYKDEVEARWGQDAYTAGDSWWRGMSDTGLADMYPSDPRFAANYGGVTGATLVRDALRIYAEENL